jgi:hypothetical protein
VALDSRRCSGDKAKNWGLDIGFYGNRCGLRNGGCSYA